MHVCIVTLMMATGMVVETVGTLNNIIIKIMIAEIGVQ